MNLKKLLVCIVLAISGILCIGSDMQHNNSCKEVLFDKTLKVGFYEYNPCYYTNEKGQIKGQYEDILKVLSEYSGFKYEYHKYSFKEALKKLENGEIDVLVGLNKTNERKSKFIYLDKPIGVEDYGLYSNENIYYSDLQSLNELELGIIDGGVNGEWVKDFLDFNDVDVKVKTFKNQLEVDEAFNKDEIDLSIQRIGKKNQGKLIYKFTTGPVYIAFSKNSECIAKLVNERMNSNISSISKEIENSYIKYFNYDKDSVYKDIFMFIGITLILVFVYFFVKYVVIQPLRVKNIQDKIRDRINSDEYLLYYQPIYNPKNNSIKGLEALLRLKCKERGILPPNEFIHEIENNNMLFDVSVWILEKVIKDYYEIDKISKLEDNTYMSINVSIEEIMDDRFIKVAKNIIEKYNFPKGRICLEIVERIKSNDVKKLNKSIRELKKIGFLIAIDDFGIEYSNLDLLEKIDFDIIKLDRFFIDDKSKKILRDEILEFLLQVSKRTNSSLVIEGIETCEQNEIIKTISNNRVYAQGYYYSRPVPIDKIKLI